jgi:hypothetical protein
MPAFFDYKIAAGWNNAGSLTNIGAVVPSSNIRFFEPVARPSWNPGTIKIRLDALTYVAGYPSQVWLFQFMTFAQYAHFRTTWCGGAYSGKVTIRTRYQNANYFNANAIAILPVPDSFQATGQGYQNVSVLMRKIIAI